MPDIDEPLADEIRRIAEIANTCPTNFQEKCFELLLQDLLSRRTGEVKPGLEKSDEATPTTNIADPHPNVDNSSDIVDSDLHVKAKNFMKKQNLTLGDINEVLYKEDGHFLPLYEDLKSTKMSESQIRIALLRALRQGLQSGTFEFDGEDVREECVQRKCYDASNFTANFKNSANFFDGFERYDKASPVIALSEEGRVALATLIRDLS